EKSLIDGIAPERRLATLPRRFKALSNSTSRFEMLEALWRQIPNPILFRYANRTRLIGDFADTRDRHTVDSLWQTGRVIGPNSEEQFEVFAAMQGQHQRIKRTAAAERAYISIDWQS